MSLQTHDEILDATEHLPSETRLVVYEFSWEDYERLLETFVERAGLRVSYDCGRLEIMTTSMRHERYVRFFDRLVSAFADARNLTVEMLGQTTWKRQALKKGVEPDCCYYIEQHAERIIPKDEINLDTDAPPDIAVEIALTTSSLRKLSLYAALGVPEMWRFDGKAVQIYSLRSREYVTSASSQFLSGLTGRMLTESLKVCRTKGQTEALRVFRQKLRRS